MDKPKQYAYAFALSVWLIIFCLSRGFRISRTSFLSLARSQRAKCYNSENYENSFHLNEFFNNGEQYKMIGLTARTTSRTSALAFKRNLHKNRAF